MADIKKWLTTERIILNVIFHIGLLIVMIYSIWVPIVEYSGIFSWHVILSTLSLIPLAAEALILFTPDNVWTHDIERNNKILIHGVLMGLAVVLMIAGIAVEIDRGAAYSQYTHFSTAHGITGLISMIFLVFAGMCGICAKYSKSLKGFLRPVITKFIHNLLGNLTFIFGITSLCCGFYTNWFQYYTSESSRLAATIVTVIICVWALIHSFISAVKQVQAIVNK